MKKAILAAALAGVMLVGGCAGGQNGDDPVEMGNEVVLKVGNTEMTKAEFQFFLDDVKKQMEGTELSTDDGWETSEIEGKKAIDIAKERAYESAVQYLSAIEIGKEMKLKYTKDEMENLKGQINVSYFEQYENSEDLINLICESTLYTTKLQEKLVEEQPVQDKEKEDYFNAHKKEIEEVYMRAKHVLFLTKNQETNEALPQEEIAAKKKQADDVLARARKGENFDALVTEYSEDPGSAQNPLGYVFTTGEMVKEFEDCVLGLKAGEIGFAETSFGYHIIQRLDLDVASCDNLLINAVYTEKFMAYIEALKEEYNITVTKNDAVYNTVK